MVHNAYLRDYTIRGATEARSLLPQQATQQFATSTVTIFKFDATECNRIGNNTTRIPSQNDQSQPS